MLGAIVGDCLGSPFEHSNLKSTSFRLFGQGTQCTDDSVLTVATADVLDDIRPDYEFDASCRGTVPVAVQAFLESSDFESAVRLAISVGGDSDTIACIAGAIAHAFYGSIPKHLLEPVMNIYLSPDLAEVSLAFCERFSVPI